jgi:dihydroorotate dehydrogenase
MARAAASPWKAFGQQLSLRAACVASHCLPRPSGLLPVEVMGLRFASPLGIAAGYDRTGRLGRRAGALGFGFNEIGSLTAVELAQLHNSTGTARLGINLTLNASRPLTEIGAALAQAWHLADYLMLNLIGPSTAPLLEPDQRPRLRVLLAELREQQFQLNEAGERHVPLAAKLRCLPGQVPPDLAELLLELGFDGLLAAHDPGPPATRERYRNWQAEAQQQSACEQVAQLREQVGDDMALMSVGGIQTREHLQARLDAGAELAQVHAALLHRGPWLPSLLL